MRVLFVGTMYQPYSFSGAERVVQTLAESFSSAGHDVVVVTLAPGKSTSEVVNGVRVHYVGLRNLYWPFGDREASGAVKPIWHALDTYNRLMRSAVGGVLDREGRFDVVNTHNIIGFSSAIWSELKARDLCVLHTLHDYYLMCPRTTMFRSGASCERRCASCRAYGVLRRQATKRVDGVIGVSEFILNAHLQEGFFATTHSKSVIRNPVVMPVDGVHKGPPGSRVRFGYLGRLHPSKGIELLLDAASALPQGGWELTIAGTGEAAYETRLRERAEQIAGVTLEGRVDAGDFLKQIDVLVAPSVWRENAPMSIYEAFSHGVPVVGSDVGGIPELVRDDETGFTFRCGSVEDLQSKLVAFIDDHKLAERLRAACLESAQRFTPEVIVANYLDVFRATCA